MFNNISMKSLLDFKDRSDPLLCKGCTTLPETTDLLLCKGCTTLPETARVHTCVVLSRFMKMCPPSLLMCFVIYLIDSSDKRYF